MRSRVAHTATRSRVPLPVPERTDHCLIKELWSLPSQQPTPKIRHQTGHAQHLNKAHASGLKKAQHTKSSCVGPHKKNSRHDASCAVARCRMSDHLPARAEHPRVSAMSTMSIAPPLRRARRASHTIKRCRPASWAAPDAREGSTSAGQTGQVRRWQCVHRPRGRPGRAQRCRRGHPGFARMGSSAAQTS